MAITNEQVLSSLKDRFGEAIFQSDEPHDFLTIVADASVNIELIRFLKDDSQFQMNFLTTLCAIHYPEQTDKEIGIVCHLHSFVNNFRMRVKFFIPASNPVIRSLIPLYPAANWMERETFDFFGVQFTGHPNLTRILNMEDMHYHPMLKQYPLEDATREDKPDEYFGR